VTFAKREAQEAPFGDIREGLSLETMRLATETSSVHRFYKKLPCAPITQELSCIQAAEDKPGPLWHIAVGLGRRDPFCGEVSSYEEKEESQQRRA
jgi:hypothetical protein